MNFFWILVPRQCGFNGHNFSWWLEAINTIGDKGILQVQMEHKVKTIKVSERHKIHPKAKAQMDIPLWCMMSMLVVRLAFKINVSKWAIEKVTKCSLSFPRIGRGRRNLLQIISTSGTFIGRLQMHHLKKHSMQMKICKGSMGECSLCALVTINSKLGCLTSQEFTRMTSLGTLQRILSC